MWIKLKRQFFGPNGFRYRKGVCEVPDTFEGKLPSDAEVLESPKVAEAPKPAMRPARKAAVEL